MVVEVVEVMEAAVTLEDTMVEVAAAALVVVVATVVAMKEAALVVELAVVSFN